MPSINEPPSSEKAAEEHSTTQQEASHSLATPVEESAGQQLTTKYKAKLHQVPYGYKDGGDQTARRVPWNKTLGTIEVAFPFPIVKVTKREILRKMSKIYDLLGLASPVTLAGKMLYRETFDDRVP